MSRIWAGEVCLIGVRYDVIFKLVAGWLLWLWFGDQGVIHVENRDSAVGGRRVCSFVGPEQFHFHALLKYPSNHNNLFVKSPK